VECGQNGLGMTLEEEAFVDLGMESNGTRDSLGEAISNWLFLSSILSLAFVPSSWISCSFSLKRRSSFSWDKARYLEARRELLFSSNSKLES